MKTTKILYWVFTSLFALLMLSSGLQNALSTSQVVKGVHEGLGYPLYLLPFLGAAKILGVVAILVPGYPRLKEWAFAGLAFDLLGATYSLMRDPQTGPGGSWYSMLIPIALFVGAYVFYHKKLKAIQSAGSGAKETKLELSSLQ